MSSVQVNKVVNLRVPFENGLRNGGGAVTYSTDGGLRIYVDRTAALSLTQLEHIESLYAALGAMINAIKNEG